MAIFPNDDWAQALMVKLNSDERYNQIAQKWEGDMIYVIEADENLSTPIMYYFDLWHGQCRDAYLVRDGQEVKAVFTLKAPYSNYVKLLKGELEPMQALMTRKISVKGNMAILMRSVPTVLDFVRCCREVTDSYV